MGWEISFWIGFGVRFAQKSIKILFKILQNILFDFVSDFVGFLARMGDLKTAGQTSHLLPCGNSFWL
jgi:hypothetical protein